MWLSCLTFICMIVSLANSTILDERAASLPAEQSCVDKVTQGYRCRLNGALTNGDANTLGTPTDLTAHGCRNACRLKPACISFGWDTAAETCKLYTKQLGKMGFHSSPTSTVTYSNSRHCYTCSKCSNTTTGLQWAFYEYNIGSTDGKYSSFEPSALNSLTPSYTGTTQWIGNIQGRSDPSPIYGSSSSLSHTYMALNHHGYLFAPTTGTYTITVNHADDIILAWVGKTAMTGWNRDNAVVQAYYDNTDPTKPETFQKYSFPLSAGEYMPYRVIYANAQGNYFFDIDFSGPDGQSMLGQTSGESPYIVQASCDGTAGPAMSFSY